MNAAQITKNICITVFGVICIQSCTELSKTAMEKFSPKPKSALDGIFLLPNSAPSTKSKVESSLKNNPLI